MKTFVAVLGAVAFLFTTAQAGDTQLTEDQAKRFVETLPALEKMSDELEANGKIEALQIESTPKAGEEFKPYSKAVAVLKKAHPSEHARLEKITKPHGFTAEEWGNVGDRVMIAYMALRMEEEDPRSIQMMEQMDHSMIEMMPPEMKAQMEGVFAMMETIKNAPEADRKVVTSVKPELDAYMEASEKS